MKIITSISIVFLLLINHNYCEAKGKKHKGCDKKLRDFATFEANFTQCAIDNAVPVTMCQQCAFNYIGIERTYNDLRHSNASCEEVYFNKDRLNIVENLYLNSKALWDKAFCSECFKEKENKLILSAINEVNSCIQKSLKGACEQCKSSYEKANSEYNILNTNFSGKICFDIQDEMNRTRVMWSKTLKCCKRTADLTIFAVISSIFSILPFLFYGGLVIYAKRRQNNQEMLIADLRNASRDLHPIEICDNSSNQLLIDGTLDEPVPGTSNEATNKTLMPNTSSRKIKKTVDNSDDDDDTDLLSLASNNEYNPMARQSSQSSIEPEINKKIA